MSSEADAPDLFDVLELERAAALGWRALETGRLGDWLLRASAGFTGRGNSVLPLGDPGLPVAEAIEHALAWYAERGLPALFQVPLPGAEELDDELEHRGWRAYNPTIVMTAAAVDVPLPVARPSVRITETPSDAWLDGYHYRGGELPAVAPQLLTSARVQGFAEVRDHGPDGPVVAIGRVAVDAGWSGVTGMEVAPSARRRGLGRLVLGALCRWGAERGGRFVYLQVAAENAPALELYERCGFREHHGYHYRVAPGS